MAEKRTLTLSDSQRAELVHSRDHDPRPFVRERCAALLKVAEGQSGHQVALSGLLKQRDPDTIYKWLDIYESEGRVGLARHQQGGNKRGRHL